MPLISAAEKAALQALAVDMVMTTLATIYHQTTVTPVSADYDYGDDDVQYLGDTISGTPVEAQVWVVNRPSVDAVDNAGMIQTISPGVMRMPVGTAVFPGDRVVIEGTEFVVIDTNPDDTWPAWLKVTFQAAQPGYEA